MSAGLCRPRKLAAAAEIRVARVGGRELVVDANDVVEPDFLARFQAHEPGLVAHEKRVNHHRINGELAQLAEVLQQHPLAQGSGRFQLVVVVAVDGFVVGSHGRGSYKRRMRDPTYCVSSLNALTERSTGSPGVASMRLYA